jgi:hypothetical protein
MVVHSKGGCSAMAKGVSPREYSVATAEVLYYFLERARKHNGCRNKLPYYGHGDWHMVCELPNFPTSCDISYAPFLTGE